MDINDDTVFHASYPRVVGAMYSRVFQGMIDQARIRKPHFLARRVVVHWALKSQLQIPLSHANNAELRSGVKEPERVFGITSYRFAKRPQGVDEKTIEWVFPKSHNKPNMFGTLRLLSLIYRSDGFVTTLAPLRDYLRPKDPTPPPLNTTKECHSTRLAIKPHPGGRNSEESLWITSEDVDV